MYTPCSKLQPETFMEGTNMTSVYLSSGLVNNKGAFVFFTFESIISRLYVAKQTGLSLALSKTPRTGIFCVKKAQLYYSQSLLLFLFTAAFSFGCF